MKKPINILIIDDDKLHRETLKDILEVKYPEAVIQLAKDGYEAVSLVKEKEFDVIIMDIVMPGIDGLETYREIREIRPDSAVIMITGCPIDDAIREALRENIHCIFYKPLDVDKVIVTINEITSKPAILVVDDVYNDCETLADIFENNGYRVLKADSGYRALELIKERKFGLVFMDIKMPGLDGVQTFLEARKIDPDIPVVMTTGYHVHDLESKALDNGASYCLHKPFQAEEALLVAERILKN